MWNPGRFSGFIVSGSLPKGELINLVCEAFAAPYNSHFDRLDLSREIGCKPAKERIMAEEKNDSQPMNWRTLLPWTELFRGFQIALDPNKLFLAAIGIFTMAVVWWCWRIFSQAYRSNPPDFKQDYLNEHTTATPEEKIALWAQFTEARRQWNLMHRATGMGNEKGAVYELEDLVSNYDDYVKLTAARDTFAAKKPDEVKLPLTMPLPFGTIVNDRAAFVEYLPADTTFKEPRDQLLAKLNTKLGKKKPSGELNTLPWSEDRGPNPFLLVTGQAGRPWEAGHFWEWFLFEQLPVVIEPVVKLVEPLVFFFQADGLPALYFFLVFASTVAIWSLVGARLSASPQCSWRGRKNRLHGSGALHLEALERLFAGAGVSAGLHHRLGYFRDGVRHRAHDSDLGRHRRQRHLLADPARVGPRDRPGHCRLGRRLAARWRRPSAPRAPTAGKP